MPSRSESGYRRYDKGGISLLLPTFLEVRSDIPQFYAQSKGAYATVAIVVTSNEVLRVSWDRLLRERVRPTPGIHCRLIRRRRVELPFKGWEKIVEHRVPGQPLVDFAWGLALYTENECLQVQIVDFREFSPDAERLWQKMIDSIRRVPDAKQH